MKTSTTAALIAVAAGLMTLSALPSAAQQRQPTPPRAELHNTPQAQHNMPQHNTPQPQPYQAQPNRPQAQTPNRPGQNNGHNNQADNRYGNWNTSWGARPAAPPRHFTRTSDWYRHVRACQQRYRSYNPSTDRYTVRRGQTALCRL